MIETGSPAGSDAVTVNPTSLPGRVPSLPGRFRIGAAGLMVTVSWIVIPWKTAAMTADCTLLTSVVETGKIIVACLN